MHARSRMYVCMHGGLLRVYEHARTYIHTHAYVNVHIIYVYVHIAQIQGYRSLRL